MKPNLPLRLSLLAAALAAVSALSAPARAMECDNFTNRDAEVADSLEQLDAFTDSRLDEALRAANDEGKGCDRGWLFHYLELKLAGSPMGRIERWAEKSPEVTRLPQPVGGSGSIYQGFSRWKLPLMKLSGIAHSVRVAGQLVGTDKFGHFMSEGLEYYKHARRAGGSLERAFEWGIATEEGYFGLGVSGVKSYADLAVNYAGYRFWSSVLEGERPYFVCLDGYFARARAFTWNDYVSPAWDEGINCSQYTQHMGEVVVRNLAARGQTCPVAGTEDVCRAFALLPHAEAFVSPVCLNMAPASSYRYDPQSLFFRKGRRGD